MLKIKNTLFISLKVKSKHYVQQIFKNENPKGCQKSHQGEQDDPCELKVLRTAHV